MALVHGIVVRIHVGEPKGENKIKKLKILKIEEAQEFVIKHAYKFNKDLIKDLKNIDARQRWLLLSRVVNIIFNQHYNLTISAAKKVEDKKQEETE